MNRNFDVIIAGSGAAGLYGALNLPKELNILVLSKMEKDLCNTALAQGGIAGVYNSPEDSPEYHKHDTFVAGGFENDPVSTDVLVNEAKTDIARLIELGCDFDKWERASSQSGIDCDDLFCVMLVLGITLITYQTGNWKLMWFYILPVFAFLAV